MKFKFYNEEIRNEMLRVSQQRKDLFKEYLSLKQIIQELDYFEFQALLMKELSKGRGNKTKIIKEINNGEAYEFRIPPHDKAGVLRVEFEIEPDYHTICITSVRVKQF